MPRTAKKGWALDPKEVTWSGGSSGTRSNNRISRKLGRHKEELTLTHIRTKIQVTTFVEGSFSKNEMKELRKELWSRHFRKT